MLLWEMGLFFLLALTQALPYTSGIQIHVGMQRGTGTCMETLEQLQMAQGGDYTVTQGLMEILEKKPSLGDGAAKLELAIAIARKPKHNCIGMNGAFQSALDSKLPDVGDADLASLQAAVDSAPTAKEEGEKSLQLLYANLGLLRDEVPEVAELFTYAQQDKLTNLAEKLREPYAKHNQRFNTPRSLARALDETIQALENPVPCVSSAALSQACETVETVFTTWHENESASP